MQGNGTQNGQSVAFAMTVRGRQEKVSYQIGAETFEAVILGNAGYFRGNGPYWIDKVGPRAAKLAGRWLSVAPGDVASSQRQFNEHLSPSSLVRCLSEDHGTLSIEGRRRLVGQSVILLHDAGDVPGTSPGTLAIAATGAPVSSATHPGRP